MRPTGGTALVVQQEDLLGPEPDEWPEELFDDEAEVIYRQDDVFPSGARD